MSKRRSQFLDGILSSIVDQCNETWVPKENIRPILDNLGLSEVDFEALKKLRSKGSSARARNRATKIVSEIYQEAIRRSVKTKAPDAESS